MRAGIVAFVTGAGLCLFLSELPGIPLWCYTLIVPLLLVSLWRYPAGRLPVCLLLGLCWSVFRADLILSSSLPDELEGQSLWLSGVISSLPQHRGNHLRFEFQVESVEIRGDEYPSPGKVRLVWYRHFPELKAGHHYRLQARLKRPHGFMNPGGFDYEAWLFAKRIRATGYVLGGEAQPQAARSISATVNRFRHHLSRRLADQLPVASPSRGFIHALALGDRQWIEPGQWQVLNRTGTSHLMAISGLHIGLIAGFGFFLGRWLWSLAGWVRPGLLLSRPAPQAGAIAGMLAALLYALLAGFAIPAQRALIMVILVMLSLSVGRRISLINLLLLALFLVVMLDPLSLISAGFWLSFAAVALIAYGVAGRTYPHNSGNSLAYIHLLLAVGLMPLLILFFAQTPILSPLANVIAVPLVSLLVVPLVLIGSMVMIVSDTGFIPLSMADQILTALWGYLSYLDTLPFSTWMHALPHPVWLLPAIIGVLILLIPRGLPGRWVGFLWLTPMLFPVSSAPASGEFDVTLLDVGQGLSVVVRTEKHSLVYDAGARFSRHFELGAAVVAPFLRQQGIGRIDTLIISHGDNDHIGGARGLLALIPAGRVLSSVPQALQDFSAQACVNGEDWQWDGVRFQLMQADSLPLDDENNRSCVLRVSTAGASLLLTGDIERSAEQVLIGEYGDALQAEILVAPHHGSKTSSSQEFLDRVKPRTVLYPLGYRNRYGFPHPEVNSRYLSLGLIPISTAQAGAISLRVGEDVSAPQSHRVQHRRFWHTR